MKEECRSLHRMPDSTSLQAALERDRRQAPEALPPGFCAAIMERVEKEEGLRIQRLSPGTVIALGLASIITAGAVTFSAHDAGPGHRPPPLEVYGSPAPRAPFQMP